MSFIKNRIKAFGHAFNGIKSLIRNESHFLIQTTLTLLTIAMGFVFKISATEWMVQLIVTALVLSVEALNTCIEKIADFVQPEKDLKIKLIKDMAAGAVLISSIIAFVVGLIIYLPKIINLF